ncbi:hypothetical protein ACPPVW_06110 [Leifsonia sp. McL0607]|uniref:hypothetical protein n=1 Tax=Leifsonia sp. McL0607 TaxID=3415672 RepID=UPI003CEDC15A
MSSRGARVARGFAAAGVATLVAALFHMVGGGQAPSALALTLSLVFSSLGSIALVGKRVAVWRLTLSVLVSQLLFHALFTLSPSATFSGMPADGHLHAGMHLTMVAGSASASAMAMPAMIVGESPWMLLSHGAAALLTIVVLLHGERTLVAVARFAFFVLGRVVDRVAAVQAEPLLRLTTSVADAPRALSRLDTVLDGRRRRGPPPSLVPAG